jgi:hypothetical protein
MEHTMIVFPMHVAILTDVEAIRLGTRAAWVYTRSAGIVKVHRQDFTAAHLSEPGGGMNLALHARKLADGCHAQ